jgi:hypothetical protein
MSSFTKPLYVEISQLEWHGRGVMKLTECFEYHVGELGSGNVITVPAGFQTDGCSIPFVVRCILPVWGKAGKAGVIHDYLCWKEELTRKQTSDIFLEAMTVLEVPRWKALLMFWAVRYYPWAKKVEQEFLES